MSENIWQVAGMDKTSVEDRMKEYEDKARLYIKFKLFNILLDSSKVQIPINQLQKDTAALMGWL